MIRKDSHLEEIFLDKLTYLVDSRLNRKVDQDRIFYLTFLDQDDLKNVFKISYIEK